ncbi:N-acetylglucosamine-6-phosphate deacetylase [Planctomycetes bacterium K23_9]|uniref:N-acetylglucosamine-6-phosphate deacetylase n=1 Tax=Stieleria marina TaxID=1930275 RepID=A0A517NMS8_9BACT|nr:N-acetylglucosamine-6-phosphate deacetylase [Planctomycetes bacterium K23_9]
MKPFDIQVNGYAGVDFCASDLTGQQLHQACEAMMADGVESILATLITDRVEHLVKKLSNFVQLLNQDSVASQLIRGFHIEGPFLNPGTGFIGAHPSECVVPANVEDTKRLLDAADGMTQLITLAPEQDPNFQTTEFLVDRGVVVSAGHCDPTLDQLRGAVDHGLTMITHFGNGCPVQLPRHDNFLQRVLHLRDRLWICFIPDGAHVDFYALRNYVDFVGVDRTIMVTDAISAAGLGKGNYEISGLAVEVDEQGVARRPGSPNLAGATITMPKIRHNLAHQLGFDEEAIRKMIDLNPRQALSKSRT